MKVHWNFEHVKAQPNPEVRGNRLSEALSKEWRSA